MSAKVPTMVDFIYDADPAALARIFEAAFARLGELGRDGGEAVRERLSTTSLVEVEEGLAQLDELYEATE